MLKIGVMFGGTSVEHEVSIISAVQAMHNLDTEKYDAIPTKEDLISWCNDRKIDTTKLFK